ncbi:MAG: glycosyltransferase family 4 protein [Proteobacteria bacterium]|nr:glycosyltransferase family 4 protein [Pseudomonadota bacterium]
MSGKRIRVANVIEEGRLGGPQVRIAEVAARLHHLGVETTVIYPRRESAAFAARLAARGVRALARPLHRLTRQRLPLLLFVLLFPFELIGLWLHFRRADYDLVHASGGCWQFKAPIAARLAGVPVLWHLNDTGTPWALRLLFKFLARRCPSGLIVAAERVRHYYVADLGVTELPVYEIQAPVDCARFKQVQVTPDEFIASEHGLAVIMVCSVNPDKGIDHLIRAAALVEETRSDIHFHVVGPIHASQSAYKFMLDELMSKLNVTNVTFHGATEDVRPALEAADIYVCSSLREASPLSVWEAMSMARPIVSTDVGDVARFLTHNESGLIVPPADPQALAQGILVLAEDSALRERFGKAAREAIKDKLDVEIIAKRHADVYRDILQRLRTP